MNRGTIAYPDRYRQAKCVDFTGVQFGTRTSMDIDGSLDFDDLLFIYMDFKLQGAGLSTGERQHLVNQVNRKRPPAMGCVLIAEHTVPIGEIIQARDCVVSELYWLNHWRTPKRALTLVPAIEAVRDHFFNQLSDRAKEEAYDDIEYFNERAAILEYEAGYSQEAAEREARAIMIARREVLRKEQAA